MMSIPSLKSLIAAAFLVAALASVATAQTVSSAARGTVTDAAGSPIARATVVITHVPSGSRRTATTGGSGSFFQPGLRVGGPYTIRVDADGFQGAQIDAIFLAPGSQRPFNVELTPVAEAYEELVVVAEAMPIQDLKNGIGSQYTSDDILNQPATSRDVIRTLLRDPLAQSNGSDGNLSVAGVNPRFNGLSIDGSLQQDDFGLGSSTYATARSPVNLDAVESASLIAADYDVAASGFTGGLVNLTIKSGTNEFVGSAYYDFVSDSFIGDKFDGNRSFDPGEVDDKEYGFVLGGPILRDRLFFFLSYDEFESANTRDFRFTDQNDRLRSGFFRALRPLIQTSTGYDPGTRPDTANTPQTSQRMLAKFDWNVSDLHRASFTYQSTEEMSTANVGNRNFQSAWYDVPVELKAYTLQFYSDWTDSLSTTFRANFKDVVRGQNCRAGLGVGQIEIDNISRADVAGTALQGLFNPPDAGNRNDDPTFELDNVIAGCDRFRHANRFDDERLQLMAKADYFVGDHVLTAGIEYDRFELFNEFVQSSRGRFIYDGVQGLIARRADVFYNNAVSNNAPDAAASWGYDKWALFLQDSIRLSSAFELSLGLRYERFAQSDAPVFSPAIRKTYGLNSSANLDGKDLILPRVSFRWDIDDRTSLTGGVGRFAGGEPKVWISNAFQTPTVFARLNGVANANPKQIPQALRDTVAAGAPLPIDLIAEDFDIPSDWKASLRLEREFFDGYIATAQYLYTQTEDGFLWRNRAQLDLPAAQPTGVAPDGRIIYADLNRLRINNLTQLTNHGEGKSHVLALGIGKRYDYGLDVNLSYAHQNVEAVTEGNSSRGISSWRGIQDIDRNRPSAKTSPFQVEHAFKLNLSWEHDFFNTGASATRIDLFVQRLSGDQYSHTFNVNNANALFGRAGQNEGPFDNSPLYLPSGANDPRVVFGSRFDQQAFFDYIGRRGQGAIEAPYSRRSAWNTLVDLRIQQELPLWRDRVRARLYLNVENVLNLLNSDWGVFENGPFFGQNAIVTADLVTAADVAANGVDGATALSGDASRTACFTAGACLYRYRGFNPRNVNVASAGDSVYRIRFGIKIDF